MAYPDRRSVAFLYDDTTRALVGARDDDGSDFYLARYASQELAERVAAAPYAARANTVVIAGDSFAANNWATTGTTFTTVQTSGAFMWANALSGQRFKELANVAVGGKTAAQVLTEQVPSILGYAPKYCYLSMGHNDLYNDTVTGLVAYQRIVAVLEALLAAGITPIWSTVWARSASAAITDDHMWCNDLLRQYAEANNVGVFFDGYKISQAPGASFGIRSNWTYDSSPSLHVNNLGAYYLGKALWKAFDPVVPKVNGFASGPDDQTNSANNGANLLVNPNFTGTGGTVGANCTGTMPTSWTIGWPTRTGTGSAAASIVDVTDSDTGLVIAKGIQVVLSGTPALNDVLMISQTGYHAQLAAGNSFSAEGVVTLTSPVLFTRAGIRAYTNSTESTWWGTHSAPTGSGTNEAFPESATLYMRTRNIAVVGASAADAGYELRLTFGGAATGTVILSQPRVRRA